jgi:hypothetical protein
MRHRFLQGVVTLAVVTALASIVWLVRGRGGRTVLPDSGRGSPVRKAPARERISVPLAAPTLRGDARSDTVPPAAAPDTATGDVSSEANDEMAAVAWSAVDMEEVRKAMPDNLYWKLSVPTKDPQVLEGRAAERARWNVQYGKILSGTASEEEIRAFYDFRAQLSGDYVEFTTYLLDHYGNTLPERDAGMLELARRLNQARLAEIPRKIEDALERKRAQDAARAAWLKDQAVFGGANPDAAAGADPNAE